MFKSGGSEMEKKRAAVFAGTTEGRRLAEFVIENGYEDRVDFLVATEYGSEILRDEGNLSVFTGRLDEGDMKRFLRERGISLVIDATHPYAAVVSENISKACEGSCEYLRVVRESDYRGEDSGIIEVADVREAAEKVNALGLKTLVTTGSKEIGEFGRVKNAGHMIVARVLPSVSSVESCLKAGISQANIIAMQGPFSLEMNVATMRQYGCRVLVTKDTGKPGGFSDKAECAALGYKVIVIRRPAEETGVTVEEAEERIAKEIGQILSPVY